MTTNSDIYEVYLKLVELHNEIQSLNSGISDINTHLAQIDNTLITLDANVGLLQLATQRLSGDLDKAKEEGCPYL